MLDKGKGSSVVDSEGDSTKVKCHSYSKLYTLHLVRREVCLTYGSGIKGLNEITLIHKCITKMI